MNKIKSLAVAIMIACGLFTLVGCSGCGSIAKTTYKTSGITHVTVRSAMIGWNEYLGVKDLELIKLAETDKAKADAERAKIGKQHAQVAEAYEKYQAAQVLALTAAKEFSAVPPEDPDQSAAQARLQSALAALTASMGPVIDLVRKFGVNVN